MQHSVKKNEKQETRVLMSFALKNKRCLVLFLITLITLLFFGGENSIENYNSSINNAKRILSII